MANPEACHHVLAGTRFGPVAIVWQRIAGEPMIRQVLLTKQGLKAQAARKALFPGSAEASCSLVDDLAARIEAFLEGADVSFSLGAMRLDLCPPFQHRALLAEYGIPRGRVSTYSRIAAHLGVPGGARAVGNALATNPFPIVIPCHRAIRSDGTLGGYQGGLAMKQMLLEQEGVEIDNRGRVMSPDLYY